jgi:hypothetical protein
MKKRYIVETSPSTEALPTAAGQCKQKKGENASFHHAGLFFIEALAESSRAMSFV